MSRYVIDAPTLLHLVDAGHRVDPGHQLVAPNSIRSEALELLLREVSAGKRAEAAALKAHEQITEMKMRLLGDRVSRRTACSDSAGWRKSRCTPVVPESRFTRACDLRVDRGVMVAGGNPQRRNLRRVEPVCRLI